VSRLSFAYLSSVRLGPGDDVLRVPDRASSEDDGWLWEVWSLGELGDALPADTEHALDLRSAD
jgi:hypothetical protein